MAEAVDEEEELAQWMPDCDDCDENPALHICKTCGDKLCGCCKDQHLRRKKTRHHEIVPYSSGLKLPQQSVSMCPKHPGERYQMFCKPCQSPVCSPCITQSHADFNHAFISIADAFSDAKNKATSNLDKMTNVIRPALRKYSEKRKQAASNVRATIEEAEQVMKRSAQLLHEEVDLTLTDSLKQLQNIREETISPVLQAQEQDDEMLNAKLEGAVKTYEESLRSDNPLDLIMFMKERHSEDLEAIFPVPTMKCMSLPRFNPSTIDRNFLRSQFGSLAYPGIRNEKQDISDADLGKRRSTTNKTSYLSTQDTQGITKQRIGRCHIKPEEGIEQHIMKNPELQTQFSLHQIHFEHLGLPRRLYKTEMMFITVKGKEILLVDLEGHVLCAISTGCKIYTDSGVCVTTDNELCFVDIRAKKVRKISKNFSISTVFTIDDYEPTGLCLLQYGYWLVSFCSENLLRVYDAAGKIIQEITDGSLLCPTYMAVNKVNNDICVSCNYEKVVVFTSNGEKRFVVTGNGSFDPYDVCCDQLGNILITERDSVHIIDRDGHFLQYLVSGEQNIARPTGIDIDDREYGEGLFTPNDLCCDQLGNILITDLQNHRVHIIDRDGQFLQYLVSGEQNISFPKGIDIDDRGYAWIVENYSGEVKAYKYLQ